MTSNNNIIIQDNFLSIDHFQLLDIILLEHDFFWSWNSILYQGDFISDEKYNRQLVHWFYPKKGSFKDFEDVNSSSFWLAVTAIKTPLS